MHMFTFHKLPSIPNISFVKQEVSICSAYEIPRNKPKRNERTYGRTTREVYTSTNKVCVGIVKQFSKINAYFKHVNAH